MEDISYAAATEVIEARFRQVESLHLANTPPQVTREIEAACGTVFDSNTQAYREALLGCLVAKFVNPQINIRQPYVDQGETAFSGRTLDEKVVNPFLQLAQVPSSKGPYLSVFRRSVQFNELTRAGLRDKAGYDAFLQILGYAEAAPSHEAIDNLLNYVLYRFVLLREQARIEIARLPRMSLAQYDQLIAGLLARASGGRMPVILVVAMLRTIRNAFKLEWEIQFAGINVADAAAGALGDVTILEDGRVLMALEITERPVEASRVQATFRSKIATSGVVDYLFMVDRTRVAPEAYEEARKYFAQGYEVNFINVATWIPMSLATLGAAGRVTYNAQLTELIEAPGVPNTVKTGWNEEVLKLTSS